MKTAYQEKLWELLIDKGIDLISVEELSAWVANGGRVQLGIETTVYCLILGGHPITVSFEAITKLFTDFFKGLELNSQLVDMELKPYSRFTAKLNITAFTTEQKQQIAFKKITKQQIEIEI